MRFIDRFGAVIFDMCETFMFGHDRFGPNEDYFATYRSVGGARMTPEEVREAIDRALGVIRFKYESPEYFENFPSVREVFADIVPPEEIDHLDATFALHEIGRVPRENHEFLRSLAKTHWIGVLSNICAHPDRWVRSCPDAATFALFDYLAFSSEGRTLKPAKSFFERILAATPRERPILFVGDNIHRDIIPAKVFGLGTAWIAPAGSKHPDADVVVAKLTDLAALRGQPSDDRTPSNP